jgi:endonuclease/exonuclease/phosphatase (EEP) superfamily protein YafD
VSPFSAQVGPGKGVWASAIAGSLTTLAVLAGGLATAGALGRDLAAQTLLANMAMHSAAAAAILSLGVMTAGWRIVGGTGLVAALALLVSGVADVDWRAVGPVRTDAVRLDIVHFNMLVSNPNGAAIAAWLEAEAPDVAILLEANRMYPYLGRLALTFPYRLACDDKQCDLLVLARYPLAEGTLTDLPAAPGRLAAGRLTKDGVTVTIAAAHWSKSFFGDLRRDQATATRRIVQSLRRGGPVVLTGDFNATHWEPEMKRFSDWLGLGHPARWVPTWPRRLGPAGFPIDHVLVSQEVTVESVATIPARLGSNHRGLRVGLAIARAAAPSGRGAVGPAALGD